jgi:hypothetical protein
MVSDDDDDGGGQRNAARCYSERDDSKSIVKRFGAKMDLAALAMSA